MTDTPAISTSHLQSLSEEGNSLLERAFKEGYRIGYEAAYARMRKSLAGGLEQAGVSPQSTLPSPRVPPAPLKLAPSNIPPNTFGAVTKTIRHALTATAGTGVGISARQFLQYCRDQGINTTINSVKDTLKRLKAGEEVENAHGLYFATERFRRLMPEAKAQADTPELELIEAPKGEGVH